MSELIVGCYTPSYREVASEFIAKSPFLGCDYVVQEIPDRGSWVLNNSACQLYLRRIHDQFPNDDFLYVDVDGMVMRDPWPELRSLQKKCDVGACYLGQTRELLSGTLYLPAGKRRAGLLDVWISMNEKFPNRWDQRNLQNILMSRPSLTKTRWDVPSPINELDAVAKPMTVVTSKEGWRWAVLPNEYCHIFDHTPPRVQPVVVHYQASRKHRDKTWSSGRT